MEEIIKENTEAKDALIKLLTWELDTLIKRYEAATGFEAISARSALRRAKSCAK